MVRCASIAMKSKTSVVNGRREPMGEENSILFCPTDGRISPKYLNKGTVKQVLPLDVAQWTRHL